MGGKGVAGGLTWAYTRVWSFKLHLGLDSPQYGTGDSLTLYLSIYYKPSQQRLKLEVQNKSVPPILLTIWPARRAFPPRPPRTRGAKKGTRNEADTEMNSHQHGPLPPPGALFRPSPPRGVAVLRLMVTWCESLRTLHRRALRGGGGAAVLDQRPGLDFGLRRDDVLAVQDRGVEVLRQLTFKLLFEVL